MKYEPVQYELKIDYINTCNIQYLLSSNMYTRDYCLLNIY